MIYSEKLVWEAVYRFLPSFRVVCNQDINLNLPSSIKSAAVECLMNKDSLNELDDILYEDILRAALKEMDIVGWMKFGHIKTIEQLKEELIK